MACFPPVPASVAAARHFVAASLASWRPGEQAQVAVLLASELVTNAIVHSGPHRPSDEIAVTVNTTDGLARIEVRDNAPGAPELRVTSVDSHSGRGLLLIDALSSRWGFARSGRGNAVWFEISETG